MTNQEILGWISEADDNLRIERMEFVRFAITETLSKRVETIERRITSSQLELHIARACLEDLAHTTAQQSEPETEKVPEILIDYPTFREVAKNLNIAPVRVWTRIFHSLQQKYDIYLKHLDDYANPYTSEFDKKVHFSYLSRNRALSKLFNEQGLLSISTLKIMLNDDSLKLYMVGEKSIENLRSLVNHLLESS